MTSLVTCIPERLAILIADCATFRTVVGAADRAAALERIHIPDALDTGEHPLPRCIINPLLGRLERQKIGINQWVLDGMVAAAFEFNIPDAVLDGQSYEDVENLSRAWMAGQIGEIMDEMETLSGTGEGAAGETHLNCEDVRLTMGPDAYVVEEQEVDDPSLVPLQWFAVVEVDIR